jgi:lysophospholipase L1-like esterase
MSLRICVIGDSIAAGTGDSRCLGWHGRVLEPLVQDGRDVTIYALGVRGDTSQDVARRWQAEASARLPGIFPAAVVFEFGLNDCTVRTTAAGTATRRVPVEETLATTAAILAGAVERWPTIMIGPAPLDDGREGPQLLPGVSQRTRNHDVRAIDAQLAAVAARVGVAYLPVFDALAADLRWRSALRDGDGIHPADEGYDVLAALVGGWAPWQALISGAASGVLAQDDPAEQGEGP